MLRARTPQRQSPPSIPPGRSNSQAVTLLDAYAVIAYLRGEPAASEVRSLLHRDASLTAVGVAEVLDHLIRLAGADEEDAVLDLAQLGLLEGIAVDPDLGLASGRLRARRYHRTRCAVSMADCIAAEAAPTNTSLSCDRRPPSPRHLSQRRHRHDRAHGVRRH